MRFMGLMLALLITGCGYQPAAYYAKSVLGESVSTEVHVLMEDPQNTVLIKDAVDKAVITKFRTSLTSKASSQSHLDVRVKNVSFSPLRYDRDGYIVTYRTTVLLSVSHLRQKTEKNYNTRGVYDFDIEPNAIISDQARFEAISQGAAKALDAFIAQLSAQGINRPKE